MAGRFDGKVHLLPVRIYYEDTDFSGFVYHSNYLKYCERGRSDFLRLVGIHHAELLADAEPTLFAVAKITLEFKRPAKIDDALTVETRFESVEGARVQIAQIVRRGTDVLVKAAVEVCCIGDNGRPKRPPDMLMNRLKPFL
jgi:acyl-CoA thioester hydrolase